MLGGLTSGPCPDRREREEEKENMGNDRYFLTIDGLTEFEVTEESYIGAARRAEVVPGHLAWTPVAWTAGPSSGRIEYDKAGPVVPPAAELRPGELEAQRYMAGRPDVDWDTHEVLFTWHGWDKPMTVDKHWLKPDYDALYRAMREMDEHESVRFREALLGESVVIRTAWFRELYAAQVKLLALEAAGVDSWDGYGEAMQDMVDSGDLDAVDTLPEVA